MKIHHPLLNETKKIKSFEETPNFEVDVVIFMDNEIVLFVNFPGENDIGMIWVQQ